MNRMGYKVYSDSYLMKLPKRKIIELLRVAEHNYFATDEALDNSARAGQKIASEAYANGYSDAKEAMTAIYGLRGAEDERNNL